MRRSLCMILLATFCMSPALANDTWPDYRGPWRNGHSDSTGLPVEWSETKNIAWKTPIHGKGWASPVVWGDQVWVTTATVNGLKMSLIGVNRSTGEVLYDKVVFENETVRPLSNNVNTYASPSPVIEEGRVYAHWGSYGTACIDTETLETRWERRDLECNHWRGPGSSPILFENLLILTFDGADHQYVVALDKYTGQTRWKTPRTTDYGDILPDGSIKLDGDLRKAYGTPVVYEAEDGPRLLSPGAKAAFGYDARTGKELWTVTYEQHSTGARCVVAEGMAFINTGYSRPQLLAVRLGGSGDVTRSHLVWREDRNVPKHSSHVVVDGLLYMADPQGVATCLEAKTGEKVWTQRIGGNYSSSLLYADGRVYAFSEEGKCVVFATGREYQELAVNMLEDGFMSSPAAAGNALFVRSKSHLYRIENRD